MAGTNRSKKSHADDIRNGQRALEEAALYIEELRRMGIAIIDRHSEDDGQFDLGVAVKLYAVEANKFLEQGMLALRRSGERHA